LHDDSIRMADVLLQNGVDVKVHEFEGLPHGSLNIAYVSSAAQRMVDVASSLFNNM